MKLKKGDTVKIRAGNDRGIQAKILRVFPSVHMVTVEGVNMRKKHMRARRQGQKGEVIQRAVSIPASRVMLVCPKCGKPTRIGVRVEGSAKTRVCKKCGATV